MRAKLRPLFLVLADFAALCAGLLIFALFHHVLPGAVCEILGTTPGENVQFDFPGKFTDGEIEETWKDRAGNVLSAASPETLRNGGSYSYRDGSLDLTVTRHTENGVTYTLADFYVKDLSRFRSAFAGGDFVTGKADSVLNMGRENDALLAVSGDYSGVRKVGVVIRNGEVYRKTKAHEICVLYRNGEMKTFRFQEFNVEKAIDDGAWQVWDFGPCLLLEDGSPRSEFHPGIAGPNPRMLLGYFEPGHYCLIAIDGRQASSPGLSLYGCALLMERLGCAAAYNLDGGHSAVMTVADGIVNSPSQPGGRDISDILYLTKSEDAS